MKDGFFKLQRKLLESDLWLTEPFTKGQAWVDLIGLANFADVEKFDGATIHVYKRGQVVTSYGTLAKRWKWSVNRVRRYMASLERAEMVRTDGTTHGTTITLENYALYQDTRQANRRTDGTGDGIAVGTAVGIADGTQINKYKERKERKNIYTPAAKTEEKKNASSLREDYGGVWLTPAEYDELEASVTDKMAFLDVLDRVGEWLQDNPRQQNRHKSVVKTFLRNDGLI